MEDYEFQPSNGQRVVNLGKLLYLACSIDPSPVGTRLGEYHNLRADRFVPVIGHWLEIAQ